MNRLLLLPLLLILTLPLSAQPGAKAFAVYARGEVTFRPDNARAYPVYPGTHFGDDGELSLGDDAYLELIHDDRMIKVTGGRRCRLEELTGDAPADTGFIQRFLNFVKRGVDQSADRQSLEEAFLRNQQHAQGNIEGYGDGGLAGYQPFGGTVSGGPIRFTWPAVVTPRGYTFRIVDSLTEVALLDTLVMDTSLTINLAERRAKDGRSYAWEAAPRLSAGGGLDRRAGNAAGTRITITYADREPDELLADLREYPLYRDTSGYDKRPLLEAMQLETAGYLTAADAAYRRGLDAHPEDALLRRNYAAFLGRWNQRARARALINSK